MHGMSPHPQGVSTPLTPSLENADKNTPAPTPTDQHDCRVPESPYTQTNIVNSVEPPPNILSSQSTSEQTSTGTINGPTNNNGGNNNNSLNTSTPKSEPIGDRLTTAPGPSSSDQSTTNTTASLLKRPVLSSRDYENIEDCDYNPQQLLYDYSTWEAWMNHPVKRFKPNDDKQQLKGNDLYANEVHTHNFDLSDQVLALPANIMADPPSIQDSSNNEGGVGRDNEPFIKSEPMDEDIKDGNLLTEKGLQPSFNDLDRIFDNSDDASNDETVIKFN